MPILKTMYETEDGQLFQTMDEALVHEQKLAVQKENRENDYEQMLKDEQELRKLFNKKQDLLEKTIEIAKQYKKVDREYRRKRFDYDCKYGNDFLVDHMWEFEARPTESDLRNVL